MSKKRYAQAVVTPQKPNGTQTDPAVYAATYWRSALRMATLRALVVVSALAAVGAIVGAMALYEQLPAAAVALGVLAMVIGVFAISLNNYTSAVAKATWYQMEQALDEDLDGDGYIGDPVGHIVTVRRDKADPIEYVLPDVQPPPGARPLVGFPITANDVLEVLDSLRDGAQVAYPRKPLKFASGTKIATSEAGRAIWREVQDGLIKWKFAFWRNGTNGREVWLRSDLSIDEMKHLVRQGANLKSERV